jgi:hypothetical protein
MNDAVLKAEASFIYARVYGVWTCSGGREVLFDRSYRPMLSRMPGCGWISADPHEFISHIAGCQYIGAMKRLTPRAAPLPRAAAQQLK